MTTTVGPATGPISQIIKAAKSGSSTEELQRLIAQNIDYVLAQPDDTLTILWDSLEDTNFHAALAGAISVGAEKDPGLSSMLFGDPDSKLSQGVGPTPGSGLLKGVSSISYLDEAGEAIQVLKNNPSVLNGIKNFLLGKPGSGVTGRALPLARTGFIGAVGVAGIQGLNAGGQDNQSVDAISGNDQAPSAPSSFNPNNMNRGVRRLAGGTAPVTTEKPGESKFKYNGPQAQGFHMMVVDRDGSITGTPGAIAVVSEEDVGVNPILDQATLQQIAATSPISGAAQGSGLENVTALLEQIGVGAAADTEQKVYQMLFPQSVDKVVFDAPAALRPSTGRAPTTGAVTRTPTTDPRLKKEGIEESQNEAAASPGLQDTNIPAGAVIAGKTFDQYNGRTLMEWASIAAQKYGVPLNLLYGIIDHESGWLTTAVGDNGNSFGLAQIYLPAWSGQISKSQALNPIFALNWTAQKLSQRFQQYGRWDAAVAAHNNPAAANYLAQNGKFLDEKSANYVGDVFNRADRSALANYLFGDTSDVPTGNTGDGVSYTPFQAPDEATSREYLEATYEDLLGRKPTEDEYAKGIKSIADLSYKAYSANLAQAKGQKSTAVDIEAEFSQGIKASGEFDFHEETVEQRSFTDYAASIARLMQQGI